MRHDPRLREGIPRLPLDPEPRLSGRETWVHVKSLLGDMFNANMVVAGVSFWIYARDWDSVPMLLIGWTLIVSGLLALVRKERP